MDNEPIPKEVAGDFMFEAVFDEEIEASVENENVVEDTDNS